MGLFINSNLASINMHKRLTELERSSEISTGLYALKDFIAQGGEPGNVQTMIETLTRLLPVLPSLQREYVIQEVLGPLLSSTYEEGETSWAPEEVAQIQEALKSVPSDYETEFRMTLRRAEDHSLKNPILLQYEHRQKEFNQHKEEMNQELRNKKKLEMVKKRKDNISKRWEKLDIYKVPPNKQKLLLQSFLLSYHFYDDADYPILQEAKSLLAQLKNPSSQS